MQIYFHVRYIYTLEENKKQKMKMNQWFILLFFLNTYTNMMYMVKKVFTLHVRVCVYVLDRASIDDKISVIINVPRRFRSYVYVSWQMWAWARTNASM